MIIEETKKHKIYKFFGGEVKFKFKKKKINKIILVDENGKEKEVKKIKGFKFNFNGEGTVIKFHKPLPYFNNCQLNAENNAKIEIKSSKYRIIKLKILALSDDAVCTIDEDFSCTADGQLFLGERNKEIHIGKNCMLGRNVTIRTTDGHTIMDKDTRNIINYGENVTISDNVWLATGVSVLKGVNIPNDCIFGIGSVVTKGNYEANSIYAGVPAKKLKSNIIWHRDCISDYLDKLN